MIHFERNLKIDATSDDVWAVLGNFMQVDEFAPEIVSVDALTAGADGIGSKRRNQGAARPTHIGSSKAGLSS